MNTQGQIEAEVCQGIASFEPEYMGRGPTRIQTHLIGDLLIVRVPGVLTAAKQHWVNTLRPAKGRDLLKEVRTQLIELTRPVLETIVEVATGIKVISVRHDISTNTGEEMVPFTLAASPLVRDKKGK